MILDALERLMAGRTSFMIAHRLSTVRDADLSSLNTAGSSSRGRTTSSSRAAGSTGSSTTRRRAEPARVVAARSARSRASAVREPRLRELSAGTGDGQRRRKIVLLGMMTKIPVAGVVWQNLHYLIGFERLGFDPYYVEAHARTPDAHARRGRRRRRRSRAGFIRDALARFGLGARWAYQALHADGRVYGMSEGELGGSTPRRS